MLKFENYSRVETKIGEELLTDHVNLELLNQFESKEEKLAYVLQELNKLMERHTSKIIYLIEENNDNDKNRTTNPTV